MAGLRTLSAGSINDVRVERLAKDLGVTKGSFYWHFQDRPALLSAMLEAWVRIDTEQIIEFVDAHPASVDPVAALEQLVRVAMAGPAEFDGVEAGIRDWSVNDEEAAALCSEIDSRRLTHVTDLLTAAGVDHRTAVARAGIIYRIIIGEYNWRRYGGEPADVDEMVLVARMLAAP
ncbi:MAG: TetR/AcrR family transcriptional regulator [Actinomycetota bacterium]